MLSILILTYLILRWQKSAQECMSIKVLELSPSVEDIVPSA